MLGIYTRLSREDKEETSINNQIKSGVEFSKQINLEHKIYKDEAISGTLEIRDRPDLVRLLDDIASDIITVVFVTNQDRLERNTEVWFQVTRIFKEKNIRLFFEGGKEFDFDDSDAVFMGNLSSIINKRYVDIITKKSKAVIERNVKDGKVHGMLAYGYTKDVKGFMIIDKEEKEIVLEIYKLSLSGVGTGKIAEILNERGVKTRYNKIGKGSYKVIDKYNKSVKVIQKKDTIWKDGTIRKILKNTLYKGVRKWNDLELSAPNIVTPDFWEQVNANLPKNANNTGKKVSYRYLLKGLLRCGVCDRNMYGRTRKDKSDHYYQCSSKRQKGGSCGNRSINIDKIEGVIWSNFFRNKELLRLIENDLVKDDDAISIIEKEIDNYQAKFKSKITSRERIIKAISNGIIDDIDAKNQIKKIKDDIVEINRLISDLQVQLSNAKNSKEIINNHGTDFSLLTDKMSFLEKKDVINKYIKEVKVTSWKNNINLYSLKIEFKIVIPIEEYLFDRKSSQLYSFKDKKVILSKYFNNNVNIESVDLGEEYLKHIRIMPNGDNRCTPFFIKEDKAVFIFNTTLPHGNISDWNTKKIFNFYKKNPNWLCKESGLSVISINKNLPEYEMRKKAYQKFIATNDSITDWLDFFVESSGFFE